MLIFAIIFVFMVLLGGLTLSYQIFKLVALDAESRGLKHPKLWGNVFTFRKSGWRRTDFIFDWQKSICVQYDRCCQSGI